MDEKENQPALFHNRISQFWGLNALQIELINNSDPKNRS